MAEQPAIEYDHEIEVWPAYFHPISSGEKRFEVRRDDRGFQKGQVLWIREYDYMARSYRDKHTGNAVFARIDWVLSGGQFGIEPGYIVMSISLIVKDPTTDQ